MQWNIYAQCGRHICSGPYANIMNVYIAVLVVTLLIALSSYEADILTKMSGICTLSNRNVEIEGHICFWHTYGNSMVMKCCILLLLLLFLMCMSSNMGLYVDNGSSALGHICVMWEAYLFRGVCQ